MTVPVLFPDGTVRNVPGQLKIVIAGEDSISSFEQVPINCDAAWSYERQGRTWVARRRNQRVTALRPPVEEWWRSIKQMAEDHLEKAVIDTELTAVAPAASDVRSAA